MGGAGSGGHNRHHNGSVEGGSSIDAAYLQKHGILTDGWTGTISWTRNDGDKNSINLFGGRDCVRLFYRHRFSGPWQDVNETIAIDWSPRHYGGSQAYFLCPKCSTRRRYLISAGARFLCRTCHGLVNASSREGKSDRIFRRIWKVKRKVAAEPALGGFRGLKPKGMHHATHARLLAEIDALEALALDDSYRILLGLQSASGLKSLSRTDFWA